VRPGIIYTLENTKGVFMHTAVIAVLLAASTIFFQDNFSDGTAEDWYTVGPSSFEVLDGRYHFSGGGAVNDATSYRGDAGGVMSTADYSMCTDVDIDVGIFGGMMIRYSEDGQYNMMLVLSLPHQALNLYRWYFTSIELVDSYPFTVESGITYRMRMQCSGNSFTGRAWLPEESEPYTWFVSASDTLTRPGAAALFSAGTSKHSQDIYMSCFFDNVVVESPEPWALAQTTWAWIKSLYAIR
jgi:hypothetical protein